MPYGRPGIMLSDLSHTRREKETDDTNHEYELLEQYSQAVYADVKLLDNSPTVKDQRSSQSCGDFEFIQCPAYIPVATTGIQSSERSSPNSWKDEQIESTN